MRWKDTDEWKEKEKKYYSSIKVEKETQKAYKAMKKAEKTEEIAPSILDDGDKNE